MKIVPSGQISATQFGLAPFDLAQPVSVDQAMAAVDDCDGTAVFLAGGTDLFLQFRDGLQPDCIIDLNGISEIRDIAINDDVLSIGAGSRHQFGIANSDVLSRLPGLSEAWALLGNVRVRGMGTLGGNLMARNGRYEGPLFAAALDARLRFQGPAGNFLHSVDNVWRGDIDTNLLLTHIEIPLAASPVFACDRSLRPIMTIAVAIESSPEGGIRGRAVIGTEWDLPVTLELQLGAGISLNEFAANAPDIAGATMDTLPQTMKDADYLTVAGTAILTRLIKRLVAAS